MSKYVIIGGSAGAIGAVEAIRNVDPEGELTVVTEELFSTYSRPMIGDYLSGEASLKKMMYRSDKFWCENNVRALTGTKAAAVNFTEKYVELDDGERIAFEKLLIATGSNPIIPKIDGSDKNGVFTFTTLADAESVKMRVEEVERALVIGGGLIGLCVAEALTKRGVEVTVVELKERILNLLLDRKASDIISEAVVSKGVNIITGCTVQRIEGGSDSSNVEVAILDNDKMIPCDMVIIATGVRPRTELVLDTNVKVNRGIVVDRYMRTNIPDIYACGDVAEAFDFVSDGGRVLPQWPVAHLGGKVAGFNMAGEKREYRGGMVMTALKYFDTPTVAMGITNPKGGEGYEVLVAHDPERALYKKVVLKDNTIKGVILVGDIEVAGIFFYLMMNEVLVEEFKETLLSQGFDLASLPGWLRKKMMMGDLIS